MALGPLHSCIENKKKLNSYLTPHIQVNIVILTVQKYVDFIKN